MSIDPNPKVSLKKNIVLWQLTLEKGMQKRCEILSTTRAEFVTWSLGSSANNFSFKNYLFENIVHLPSTSQYHDCCW